MAAEKWTRERRRELTRTALIDAAAEVFALRGFEAASLEEIAETAGFTRGAVYKNFGGKEDLFLAVCERLVRGGLDAFTAELAPAHPIADLDLAAEIAKFWQKVDAAHPSFFVLNLEFRLYATRNETARERFVQYHRATVDLVASFIKERSRKAEVKLTTPPRTLAEIIVAASYGFEQAAYFDPPATDVYTEFLKMLIPDLAKRPQRRQHTRR